MASSGDVIVRLQVEGLNAVWPDWAIFRHLGDFLKPLAQFFFKKRAQKFGSILGDFLKRVKILIFIVISTLASKEK